MQTRNLVLIAILAGSIAQPAFSKKAKKPNVVVVITDDQGYGDVAFTGNPAIKTPAIDKLRSQGTLLNNFHIAGDVYRQSQLVLIIIFIRNQVQSRFEGRGRLMASDEESSRKDYLPRTISTGRPNIDISVKLSILNPASSSAFRT